MDLVFCLLEHRLPRFRSLDCMRSFIACDQKWRGMEVHEDTIDINLFLVVTCEVSSAWLTFEFVTGVHEP